jgi:hypothetical protein
MQCLLHKAGHMYAGSLLHAGLMTTSESPEAAECFWPILYAGRAADDEHGAGGAALQETASTNSSEKRHS